jgi:hypothetical protein
VEVSVLLDSVILIDHLNGHSSATRYLRQIEDARISVITRAEVLAGLTPSGVDPVRRLLDRYPTLEIGRDIAISPRNCAVCTNGGCPMPFRRRWRSTTASNWRPAIHGIFLPSGTRLL